MTLRLWPAAGQKGLLQPRPTITSPRPQAAWLPKQRAPNNCAETDPWAHKHLQGALPSLLLAGRLHGHSICFCLCWNCSVKSSRTKRLWAPAARITSNSVRGPARHAQLEANKGQPCSAQGSAASLGETIMLASPECEERKAKDSLIITSFFAQIFTFPHVMQEAMEGHPINYLRPGTGSNAARSPRYHTEACFPPSTHSEPLTRTHCDRTHAPLHSRQNTHAAVCTINFNAPFLQWVSGDLSQCASWVCWALLTGVSGQDGGLLEGSCKDTVILNTKSSKAVPVMDMY